MFQHATASRTTAQASDLRRRPRQLDANVPEASGFSYSSPRMLKVGQMRLPLLADDHKGIARDAGRARKRLTGASLKWTVLAPVLLSGRWNSI
jgi:hypothetical protein